MPTEQEAHAWLRAQGVWLPGRSGVLLPSRPRRLPVVLRSASYVRSAFFPFPPFPPFGFPLDLLGGLFGGLFGPPSPGEIAEQWVTRLSDPIINFLVKPLRVTNVVVHVIGTRIEGDVVVDFLNESREGQQYEENLRTGQERNRSPISGSADLAANLLNRIQLPQLSTLLGEVQSTVERALPNFSVNATGHFTKTGPWELIKSIYTILTSGQIETSNGIDGTVVWFWQGQDHTMSKHFDIDVWLPIEGETRYEFY